MYRVARCAPIDARQQIPTPQSAGVVTRFRSSATALPLPETRKYKERDRPVPRQLLGQRRKRTGRACMDDPGSMSLRSGRSWRQTDIQQQRLGGGIDVQAPPFRLFRGYQDSSCKRRAVGGGTANLCPQFSPIAGKARSGVVPNLNSPIALIE